MSEDNEDPLEAELRSFAANPTDIDTNHHDEDCLLHVTITLELPGGWGLNTIPLTLAVELLDRLEHDGIRPYRTTIDITDKPTT